MQELLDTYSLPSMVAEVAELAHQALCGTGASHDWSHTERVLALALRLGQEESADLLTLALAALLHDVGREDEYASNGRVCHAEASCAKAQELLAGLQLPTDLVNNALHCIAAHRFRGRQKPRTLEALILRDADKLDALGAIGVARAYLWLGEHGRDIHSDISGELDVMDRLPDDDSLLREWKVKLQFLEGRMHTQAARRLASGRHRFMAAFLKRFERELQGKA